MHKIRGLIIKTSTRVLKDEKFKVNSSFPNPFQNLLNPNHFLAKVNNFSNPRFSSSESYLRD